MELQMKAICDGTTNRRDVVNRSLEQYRAVFIRTVQQMSVIKAVRTPACTYLNSNRLIDWINVQAVRTYILQPNGR
jgi:DNA topoisomerase-3